MTGSAKGAPGAKIRGSQIWLRVLATSDVHAHLRGFDYARNEPELRWGLTRLATRVAEARHEAPLSVLLDNGDILQGTPLAQLYSAAGTGAPHPVTIAMEAMRYDAMGLGNHEFNYGLDRLQEVVSQTQIPVLCGNVLSRKGANAAEDVPLHPPYVMLHRTVADPATGDAIDLVIGVVSVVPPQVMTWDGAHLKGRVETRDMVESVTHHAAQMRAEGADVVLLLAHCGIDPMGIHENAENAAVALARVPGVDAMITGHTHRLFPDAGVTGEGIDGAAGTLFGVPTVMPGYRGAHLGVIDLVLERRESGWSVVSHAVALRAADGAEEDPTIVRVTEPAHRATMDYIAQPLGHSARPIHSYLSVMRDDLPTRIVAMAQRADIAKRLEATRHGALPLLSASAPYQTGGRSGPGAYVDIPAGGLTVRDANSLYPFPNTLCAVLATGAEVYDWLQRSASAFHQIHAGQGEQMLLNPAFPGHAIDTLYGLTYRINLNVPPAYDEKGTRLLGRDARPRIVDLRHEGAPVRPKDWFIVAVNGYRAYGGGPYAAFPADRIVVQTDACALQALMEFIRAGGVDRVTDAACWSFLPVAGAGICVKTGPGLICHGSDVKRLGAVMGDMTEDGFLSVSLRLDHNTCESAA